MGFLLISMNAERVLYPEAIKWDSAGMKEVNQQQ